MRSTLNSQQTWDPSVERLFIAEGLAGQVDDPLPLMMSGLECSKQSISVPDIMKEVGHQLVQQAPQWLSPQVTLPLHPGFMVCPKYTKLTVPCAP